MVLAGLVAVARLLEALELTQQVARLLELARLAQVLDRRGVLALRRQVLSAQPRRPGSGQHPLDDQDRQDRVRH